jgi:hypothetical protein
MRERALAVKGEDPTQQRVMIQLKGDCMEKLEDEPTSAPATPDEGIVAAERDTDFERRVKLGLEILERYREVFEALAKT